jgi:hypothetical protein
MTLMTKLATAAAFTALLGFSTPSHAQGKSGVKAKTTKVKSAKAKASAVKTKTAKTKRPKTKDYDFMADEIDGDRVLPNLDRIIGIGDSKHASLIRLRQHFIPEIIRTADML